MCTAYTALLQRVYKDFGFTDIIYKVATRPAARIGSDELWGQGRASADGQPAHIGLRVRDLAG